MSSTHEIVLPAHRVRNFDPIEIFNDRVKDRTVVYLDHNIWIDLRDAVTPDARSCRDVCLRAVDDGLAVFPVAFASMSEMFDVPADDVRVRHAELMDALSLGVALRNSQYVYAMEGEAAYRYVFHSERPQSRRNEVFTAVQDYLADSYTSFPEGWRRADVERFLAHLRDPGTATVKWLVEHCNVDEIRAGHARTATYAERMEAQRQEYLAKGPQRYDLEAVVRNARRSLFAECVMPAIRRCSRAEVTPAEFDRLVHAYRSQHGDGNDERLRKVFREAAPVLEVFAHVVAAQSADPRRRSRPQDFWDIEHAGYAPVYTDAFVTADGGLRARLPVGQRRPPAAQAAVLDSVSALRDWILSRKRE
jgi:hypothetical protein